MNMKETKKVMVVPFAGTWIETAIAQAIDMDLLGRSLRGNVD